MLSRIARLFGRVAKADLEHTKKRLLAEIEQQNGYLKVSKKKLDGLKGNSPEWQTAQQEVFMYTGRRWGIEIALAEIGDLLR